MWLLTDEQKKAIYNNDDIKCGTCFDIITKSELRHIVSKLDEPCTEHDWFKCNIGIVSCEHWGIGNLCDSEDGCIHRNLLHFNHRYQCTRCMNELKEEAK